MDGSVLKEKWSFKIWGWLSLVNWIGALILSLLLKLPPRKLELLFYEVSFSSEVALHLCKSTIQPYMECCCYVWAGAPSWCLELLDKLQKWICRTVGHSSCCLELLDKLQKWICRTVGPSFAASLECFAHHRNVASLSLVYRYYFRRCSSELAQLVPLPCSWKSLLVILIDCMTFLSPFLDLRGMSILRVSFITQLGSGILCLQNAFLWPIS